MTVKIGYKASAEQFGPRALVEYAVHAEQVGLDSAFVSDHFLPWRHEGGHAPAAIPWLAAVGERTSRIQLGTSVLTPTFRYNPAVLAQDFATMALLTEGRVILGVGTGEALNEVAVSGREWPDFKERFARLRESVRLMRALWTEESVSFDGDYYTTVDASIYDRPDAPVPVYIAAGGPQMARYAGRAGDGIICTSGKGMELYTDKLMPSLAEGREKAGNPGIDGIDRMIEIKISYDRDRDQALENTRFWAPLSLTAEQKQSVTSSQEMEKLADELPIDQIAQRWIVTSDPDEAVEQIRPYVEAGLDHLVLHGPGGDQQRFLDQVGEDLVPRLRELGIAHRAAATRARGATPGRLPGRRSESDPVDHLGGLVEGIGAPRPASRGPHPRPAGRRASAPRRRRRPHRRPGPRAPGRRARSRCRPGRGGCRCRR